MRNGQLAFGRFWWRDLSFQEARGGRTNRSLHFETRLFNALPWVCLEGRISDRKDDQGNKIDWNTLVSPLPNADILKNSAGNSNIFLYGEYRRVLMVTNYLVRVSLFRFHWVIPSRSTKDAVWRNVHLFGNLVPKKGNMLSMLYGCSGKEMRLLYWCMRMASMCPVLSGTKSYAIRGGSVSLGTIFFI